MHVAPGRPKRLPALAARRGTQDKDQQKRKQELLAHGRLADYMHARPPKVGQPVSILNYI
jgi:hypothetical protein